MTDRTDYFLQILNTLGAPLMRSLIVAPEGAKGDDAIAQHMASLLSKSVETSIALGPLVEIDKMGDQTDSVRVALAAVASEVLAALYRDKGGLPQDDDITKIKDGFQTVITFADNFTADGISAARLSSIKAAGQPVDAPQSQIQYLHSFVPVIQAVAAFSFGKTPAQLLPDIAGRLTQKAQDMRRSQFGEGGDKDTHQQLERGLLHALAGLYAACHEAETARLSAGASDDNAGSIDTVWAAFDLQATMLEALVDSIVPGGAAGHSDAGSSAPKAESTDKAPVADSAPAPEQKTEPSSPDSPPPKAPPAAGGNPMSFFKPPSEKDADPKAESAPEDTQDQDETPPSAPPASEPPPSSDDTKDKDKGENKGEDQQSGDAGDTGGSKANPMSFFKKSD